MTQNLLLGAIALGLWANAAATWVRPAHAQSSNNVELYLSQIARNTMATADSTRALARGDGGCLNIKICD